jgi:hypothetical protein
VTTGLVTAEFAMSELVVAELAMSELVVTEFAVSELVVTEFAVSELVVAELAITDGAVAVRWIDGQANPITMLECRHRERRANGESGICFRRSSQSNAADRCGGGDHCGCDETANLHENS